MSDTIVLLHKTIRMNYKTQQGRLQDLFMEGNQYRIKKGMQIRDVDAYLGMNSTKEFLAVVEEKTGTPPIVRKGGRFGGTWASLLVLMDAAAYLDPEFKYMVYRDLIERKLLYWREASAGDFKSLMAAIKVHAETVLGKPAHSGHYINIAKTLRNRLLGEDHPGWHMANPEQLRERDRIESALTAMVNMGMITSWDQMKEMAAKV